MESNREVKAWREVRKKGKWADALRGLYVFWKVTINFRIQLVFAFLVVLCGFYFNVSVLEWLALVFSIGLVLVTEALNTAIEIDIDLTSPEYHPFARDTKDVSAGAVLLSSIVATIIGLIIFIPKIMHFWYN